MNSIVTKKSKRSYNFLVVSAVFLFLFFGGTVGLFAQDSNSIAALRNIGKAFSQIAQKASPAVVGIKAERVVKQQYSNSREDPFNSPFGDDFFDYFFRRQQPRSRAPQPKSREMVQGSGFVVTEDGYILTNNHVVENAEKITVKLGDKEYDAKLIGTDPESEVAVIKIGAKNLAYLELANSDKIEVGEWVLAIGNPFGLSHTVTAGIVSAKGRSNVGITTYEDFIQTDAAINPGNSGGPLLNLDGKAVGINTAIYSAAGGNVGIGFAVPINMAKNVYEQLVNAGTVVRGYLGVVPADITPTMANYFGLKEDRGVILNEVTNGSAADKAGLKQGDIVVKFNGKAVKEASKFREQVAMIKPDTDVKVIVLRDGKQKELTVTLSKRPSSEELASGGKSKILDQLGIGVQNLSAEVAHQFGYEGLKGVIVTDVESGSLASRAGLVAGSLIMEVNQMPIDNTTEFGKALKNAEDKGSILLLVRYRNYSRYMAIELPSK